MRHRHITHPIMRHRHSITKSIKNVHDKIITRLNKHNGLLYPVYQLISDDLVDQ